MLFAQRQRKLATAVFFIFTLPASLSYAQPGGQGRRPAGPPPEAIEACTDLAVGDACSFSGRRGDEVQGACFAPQQEGASLACAPEGMRPPEPENEN